MAASITVNVTLSDKRFDWCIQELTRQGISPTLQNIEAFVQKTVNEAIDRKVNGVSTGPSYVYTLAYPESMGGKIFYVGKGMGERIRDHAREARKGVQSQKCDVIREICAAGEKVVATKVHENLSDIKALELERQLIYEIGYENLVNVPPRTKDRSYKGQTNQILL